MNTRFLRFLTAGGTAAVVEYAVFTLLQMLLGRRALLLSQSVSFALGFTISFLLNRVWVFRSVGIIRTELLKYGTVAGVNLIVGDAVIAALAGPLLINPFLSKLIVMAMIAGWNYIIFSKFIFRTHLGKA